ncbi:TIGR03936 family radical SAM-associated protein [Pelosinus baikalensis]|uniref:TIGR03936 family radical SAM-associated protein n=1 Tax=Pelosinus baikalensis TaxID=2892015 RepID=A0ABS8HX53_9FIRM|nr:TIGR03936 family radical SAM-associated protein [Pelosinus baikalensis]MCC5466727.1 TIGR03936 family radical SAM-associated protein [Pelosinus baikalensis]
MAKLRLEITKGEEIRYISHLDYASAMERAIIRAKLPVAYSEGFNPHMKISFASALAVGVTSQAEYIDIECKAEIDVNQAVEHLKATLPMGIRIKGAAYMQGNVPALMAIVNLATYEITVPLLAEDIGIIEDSIRWFNEAEAVLYMRESPKGKKEIEIKQYMVKPITLTALEKAVRLILEIRITPTGSIKPGEVLGALVAMFDLPVDIDNLLIHRTGLYISNVNRQVSPVEL